MNENTKRIHILGASGSGATTLGSQLAKALGLPHFDSDHFFWEPTDPPFTTKRGVEERRSMLEGNLPVSGAWVLSGSVSSWGNFLKPAFTHVVFLSLSSEIRRQRLYARELEKYGERIFPGGDMEQIHSNFLAWAMTYDSGGTEGRSRALHEQWIRSLPCPVLRIDGVLPTAVQTQLVLDFLPQKLGEVTVSALRGLDAAPLVDPFFESMGNTVRAKPEDLFFVARWGGEVVGVVRHCVEDETHMLRGMLIAERARKQGVGTSLLRAFDAHVKRHKLGPVFCLPHEHLISFYGGIGFRRIRDTEAPPFLQERLRLYRENSMPDVIAMKRA